MIDTNAVREIHSRDFVDRRLPHEREWVLDGIFERHDVHRLVVYLSEQ